MESRDERRQLLKCICIDDEVEHATQNSSGWIEFQKLFVMAISTQSPPGVREKHGSITFATSIFKMEPKTTELTCKPRMFKGTHCADNIKANLIPFPWGFVALGCSSCLSPR